MYIREKWGPIPKHMLVVQRELENEGKIRVKNEGQLKRVIALVPPDVSDFSAVELKEVKYWIDHIDQNHSAASISDESHDYAWDIAKMGEEIPMHAILANRIREPTDEELAALKKRAKALGLM